MRRLPLTLLIAAGFFGLIWFVSLRQSLLFLIGIGMGTILAGARFGFTTGWRRLIEHKDTSGVMAQIVLLAVAALISIPLLAYFPSDLMAALGPPSVSLLVGAFVFGAAMQVADGCGSGTLYKAGMGIPLNMAILPMFALGSFLGSAHLNHWLSLGAIEPVGLIDSFGALPAVLLTLAGLGLTGLFVYTWGRRSHRTGTHVTAKASVAAQESTNASTTNSAITPHSSPQPWFDRKLVIAGIGLALLAVLNLIVAGQPWGVVYGFGLWGAKLAAATGVFDPTTNAFWGQAGNLQALQQTIFLDVTTITNIGIMAGALWIAARKAPSTKSMTSQQWFVGIIAGFLLGYSSRLAFGCNVGAMVSGISTGSLHGWIWVVMAFSGSLIGVRLRRRYSF